MISYVYFLKCADDSIYTGWTNNLEKRLLTHNAGKGAKYTRARLPVVLAYYEHHADRSLAQKREYFLRNLKRSEKQKIITAFSLYKTTKEQL